MSVFLEVSKEHMDMSIRFSQVGWKDVEFGPDCHVMQPSNLYGCKLGENVFVGPFVEIQELSIIGNNTRIQSHSFICSHVVIGDHCFVGHGVTFINDKFSDGQRAHGDPSKIKETSIGNHVLIGSGAVILPVKICSNVTIGAGSVVTKNIDVPGTYYGNPARLSNGCQI